MHVKQDRIALKNLPTTIKCTAMDEIYSLIGCVEYTNAHYKAIVKKGDTWVVIDDTIEKPKNENNSYSFIPAMLFFIKQT